MTGKDSSGSSGSEKSAARNPSVIRKHETSGETPGKTKSAKTSLMRDTGNSDSMDMKAMFGELMKKMDDANEDHRRFRQSVESRLDNMESSINTRITQELQSFKDKLHLEVAAVKNDIQTIETNINDYKAEVVELRKSVADLEKVGNKEQYSFDPDRTVVVTGVPYSRSEDILQKAKDLVGKGLELGDVEVINVTRTPSRDNKPGIVKVEFNSREEKLSVLRAKLKLQSSAEYKRVFIRSAQSHVERLVQINNKVILKELGVEHKFRFTGNGRLVLKDQAQAQSAHDQAQTPPERMEGEGENM